MMWFLSLRREYKIVVVTLLCSFLVSSYYGIKYSVLKYKYFKEQEKKVKVLEQEKESLIKSYDSLFDYTSELEVRKDRIRVIYKDKSKKLKNIKDEEANIPNDVVLFSDEQLDRTIRSHKHPKRD